MFIKKILFKLCFGFILGLVVLSPTIAFADVTEDSLDESDCFNRGTSYESSGQYDLAIEEYSKAIATNPNYANPYIKRGALYHYRKQFDLAIMDYTKAIEINPNSEKTYNLRGCIYMNKNQYDLATIDFSKSIELNSKNKKAFFNRGFVYYLTGQYELATVDFSKTIELDPQNIQPYYGRGESYYAMGKYELAIIDYAKVSEINPQFSAAYYREGLALSQLKQNKSAIKSFRQYLQSVKAGTDRYEEVKQRVLELERADAVELSIDELYWLGNRLENKQNFVKANEYYSEVIKKNQNYKNIYAIRGLTYVFMKKYDLALADYLKAIELNPNEYGFYQCIGNIYAVKQKYDLAIKEYTKSIELKDTYFARKGRGKTYFQIHKYDLAMDDFNRMEVLWPRKDESVICRASLYGALGNYEECIAISQDGLNKFTDHPILLFLIGQPYEKQGNIDEAINYYKKANENQSTNQITRRLTVPVRTKLVARLAGEWNSYKEWNVAF